MDVAATPPGARTVALALKGHSGARLTLIEDRSPAFIRKSATEPSQNARLREQCRKLQAAHAGGVACPAVYRADDEGGLFFFDMEFVPGETLAHAIASGKSLHWDALVGQIGDLLARFRGSEGAAIPQDAFRDKLARIRAQSLDNPHIGQSLAEVERLIGQLLEMPWSGIHHSECHGDLTLENMLVCHDGSLVFLDFDVPEQSSWQLDVGKIYQDVLGQWCLRGLALGQPDGVDLLNAQVGLARMADVLAPSVESLFPCPEARMAQLAGFHLARTLPYAQSADVVAYVVERMDTILRK